MLRAFDIIRLIKLESYSSATKCLSGFEPCHLILTPSNNCPRGCLYISRALVDHQIFAIYNTQILYISVPSCGNLSLRTHQQPNKVANMIEEFFCDFF